RTRVQPPLQVLPSVPNRRSDLHKLRPSTEESPSPNTGNAHLEEGSDLVLIHHFGRLGMRLSPDGCRVDRWQLFLDWLADLRCWLMAILVLQFGDPQIEPFNLLDCQQVNLSQKINDFRLG